MDLKAFTNPSGRIIRTPLGYDAFVPDPLPQTLNLSPDLLVLLSRADRSLGELMGMARMLPNQQLLIAPLTSQESVLSSQIEGTQSTITDLAIFEAAGEFSFSPDSDVREVRNYRRALNDGIARLPELPLSLRFVRDLHADLLLNVRGQDKTPGEFRTEQVWIGPPGSRLEDATYVAPPPSAMADCLHDWEAFLHVDGTIPKLVQCAMLHYQFEAIHPFVDGNGRVGRLLLVLYLLAEEYVSTPILYLSPYFARHRDEYYVLLRGVSERSAWHSWIEFFLRGVIVQAREGLRRAQAIVGLQQSYHRELEKAPRSALRLIDLLFMTPAVTASQVALELGVTWATASAAVNVLCEHGILREVTGQRRDRVYLAEGILERINRELDEDI